MQISVSGQHISIGNSLQDYVKSRTTQVAEKYFSTIVSANVHFSKQGFQLVCDIVMNDGTGRHIVLKGNAASDDIYSAFDTALSRLEKQLRKYKSKLKDRHDRIKISEAAPKAVKYTITPHEHEDEDNVPASDNPVIIAEKSVEILTLSVSEAVMKMDLENLPALMFQNSNTNRINIVYYRRDGNISWIDSK
ncbi:MAG: ribosome-associated translation inhibitor RaiA [Rickettsia endosymbiont of Culicoides impunctatus]|uniref:ribosome hibernation-promoting factor, HPF/YfiA family n=1 Tax=Candidatus Tisiphia endosymbiont of Sialis lutaria TaxID=2029164 RepID=UPI001E7F0EA7|nr:ribosome-associated translation inhibitor RaiA [Rickettsia endosymbiont of Platyusa sonomae]UCM86276.1 MAG: ribosome-associated translation inhibitor RaiA [Rickettsia endosymbiont of Culicoides impunctatus]